MRGYQLMRVAAITLAVCGVLLLVAAGWLLRGPVALFFLSVGLSAALNPAVAWLVSRRCPKWLALGAMYSTVAAVILAVPLWLVGPAANEFGELVRQFQQANEARQRAEQSPQQLQSWLETGIDQVQTQLGSSMEGGASAFWQVLGFTWGVFEVLGNVLVVFVLSVYWSSDRDHFERLWLSLLSVERRAAARDLWRSVEIEVGAYVRSEAVQCLLAGVSLAVGYRLLGFPFPTLMAIIGALAWLVPYLGMLIAVSATFVLVVPEIVASGDHVVWMIFFPAALHTMLVLGFLEYFVEPRFFDRKRYNSLLVLLFVIVLTETFGITGLLLGPPIAAALQLVGGYLLRQRSSAVTSTEEPTTAWGDRIEEVWKLANETDNPAPELMNLLERLTKLSRETQQTQEPQTA